MNETTRQFLRLILEEKEEKPKSESESQDSDKGEEGKGGSEEPPQRTKEVFDVETSNNLTKGRPINDVGLANMMYRSDGDPAEAKEMLDELKIKGGGSSWFEAIASVLNSARGGEMRTLIQGATVVQSKSGIPGVRLRLNGIWRDDDKGGKRSFGMIRAIIVAASNVGYISGAKNVRVEEVVGQDALIFYKAKKAKSWQPKENQGGK